MSYAKWESVQVNTFDVRGQLPAWIDAAAREAAERGERDRAAIAGPAMLEARQRYIRESLIRSLGGLPGSDCPLRPTVTGIVRGDGFRVEKIVFESRPRVYVTGNLYVPDGMEGPGGAVLLLCGHREQAKHCAEYQTVCQYLVRAGLVVLAIDPVGQGERFGYYDPQSGRAAVTSVWEHEQVGRQCLAVGDNLARYMLHDAMRAIDYMSAREEIDPRRIGVTGHSGGGTQASLAMMADPRIACAAPGGFIMNRPYFRMTGKTQDAEQKWPGFSAMGLDHEDILLAMAPRPVLVLATTYDSVPIEAARHTVEVNRRFWDMYGRGDDLGLFEDRDVHRFTVPLAKAAAAFFARHLLGRSVGSSDDGIAPFPPEALWCTKSGQAIGELEGARSVLDENAERVAEFARTRSGESVARNGVEAANAELAAEFERARSGGTVVGNGAEDENAERVAASVRPGGGCADAAAGVATDSGLRSRAVGWLKDAVYRGRAEHPLHPRRYDAGEIGSLRATRMLWWSQRGIINMGYLIRHRSMDGRSALPVTVAVWDGGVGALGRHAGWIEATCASGRLVLALNPTGVGPLTPYMANSQDDPLKPFGVLDKHTDELMLLGDSMAAWRTYDVLRAVELAACLEEADPADIRLYGHGRYAVYAGWAALLDPRVRSVRMEERLASIGEWACRREYDMTDSLSFVLPGMLRRFDLPDMDRWLREEGRFEHGADDDDAA